MNRLLSGLVISCCSISLSNCGDKPDTDQQTTFTKADSVTDKYLMLQDSMLLSWNIMINDDNHKIKAMHNLLHELSISHPEERDQLLAYRERLDQLRRIRYTQKSMANSDVIAEYDLASNSLVEELIKMAESKREFTYNTTLQKLVDKIRAANQRVNDYREEYDNIVMTYNRFVDENRPYLTTDFDTTAMPEKKPMFRMVAEE